MAEKVVNNSNYGEDEKRYLNTKIKLEQIREIHKAQTFEELFTIIRKLNGIWELMVVINPEALDSIDMKHQFKRCKSEELIDLIKKCIEQKDRYLETNALHIKGIFSGSRKIILPEGILVKVSSLLQDTQEQVKFKSDLEQDKVDLRIRENELMFMVNSATSVEDLFKKLEKLSPIRIFENETHKVHVVDFVEYKRFINEYLLGVLVNLDAITEYCGIRSKVLSFLPKQKKVVEGSEKTVSIKKYKLMSFNFKYGKYFPIIEGEFGQSIEVGAFFEDEATKEILFSYGYGNTQEEAIINAKKSVASGKPIITSVVTSLNNKIDEYVEKEGEDELLAPEKIVAIVKKRGKYVNPFVGGVFRENSAIQNRDGTYSRPRKISFDGTRDGHFPFMAEVTTTKGQSYGFGKTQDEAIEDAKRRIREDDVVSELEAWTADVE